MFSRMIAKRVRGVKYIPQLYTTIYHFGKAAFVISLILFPIVLVVAILFGRSQQRAIDDNIDMQKQGKHNE